MTNSSPRIALISATPAAIGPAVAGMSSEFPAADVWNILDDKLLSDASERGGVTPDLQERMRRLIAHAITEGADGVLLTCSQYGVIATDTTAAIPVMSPDEAAFETALSGGYERILLVASLQGALDDSVARFGAVAKDKGSSIEILGAASAAAFEATKSGSNEALLTALTATIEPFVGQIDAVLLTQYSLAPVALELSDRIALPVISGPQSAAAKLRDTLQGNS
jgi:hypothetical protein